MPLLPKTLTDPDLPKARVGGYQVEATNQLLKTVADEINQLRTDRAALAERNAELEQELTAFRRRVAEIVGAVTGTGRGKNARVAEAVAAAVRAAQDIRHDAREDGRIVLKSAERRARELDQTLGRIEAAKAASVRELEERQRQVKDRLAEFLTTMLNVLDDDEPTKLAAAVREFDGRPLLAAEPTALPSAWDHFQAS